MHPEVRNDGPGDCPKCGMALEPLAPTGNEEGAELRDVTRRFWISALLSVPLVVVGMAEFLPDNPFMPIMHAWWFNWAELALATPIVVWAGWPFFTRFYASVRTWNLNMFTLIGLGVSVAYLYSVAATIAPNWFPQTFRENGNVLVYYEAAAIITTLVLLGQVLELRARSQTSNAIKQLLGLAPKTARLVETDGTEHDVPLESV